MKGSGKPASFRGGNKNPRVPWHDVRVKCTKDKCGKWFSKKPYQTGTDYELCPKHRREFHEQEAEEIAARIERQNKDVYT